VLVAVGMLEDVEGVAERSESLPVDASGVALFFVHVALFFLRHRDAVQMRCVCGVRASYF